MPIACPMRGEGGGGGMAFAGLTACGQEGAHHSMHGISWYLLVYAPCASRFFAGSAGFLTVLWEAPPQQHAPRVEEGHLRRREPQGRPPGADVDIGAPSKEPRHSSTRREWKKAIFAEESRRDARPELMWTSALPAVSCAVVERRATMRARRVCGVFFKSGQISQHSL